MGSLKIFKWRHISDAIPSGDVETNIMVRTQKIKIY